MKKKAVNERLKGLIKDADLRNRVIEHLYSGEPLFGEGSVFSELLGNAINQILEGEIEHFLETERAKGKKNKRNGFTKKQVLSSSGKLLVHTPRDRNGDFEPELIEKRQRELANGIDGLILALYAQGSSVEDIRRIFQRVYGVTVSDGKISAITDKILPEIQAWRSRRLASMYVVVYLDGVLFKVRQEGHYSNNAILSVYGIDVEGNRDLLGLYTTENEGARSWARVLEDLKDRGVEDVLIFCTDDLAGLSEAISEVFPESLVQKCIVHKVRSSTRFVDSKDMRPIRKDLRKIYTAPSRESARTSFEAFKVTWGNKYERLVKSWEDDWDELIVFLDYPKALQRLIYTTNPVEALHRIIRKLIKGKAAWVSKTALIKQIYLSLMYNEKSWKRSVHGWKAIQRDLVKIYGYRVAKHLTEP